MMRTAMLLLSQVGPCEGTTATYIRLVKPMVFDRSNADEGCGWCSTPAVALCMATILP
ncbi:hypothetical protein PF002_g3501 [Phytophthora fragariae]|uniref:Uncharacterized protein n=1 Tax=Phytophthora fragariae TaxID=53985 RepID=A0A6A4A8L7_9STRA|nr:hypothetical protein PF003_g25744 [Phytophthora fragariae]KAE9253073.1 hypothetical protein PF002_g3501 [Phytophthora fragariae]